MTLTEIEALAASDRDSCILIKTQTVKAMCALIKQQHEAMKELTTTDCEGFTVNGRVAADVALSALAAYEEFNK